MANQTLGGVAFYRNPLTMDIPESKKTVSIVDTYSGSAIFQWAALLQGTQVILKWEWVTLTQYNNMRASYLSLDSVVWFIDTGISFNVVVANLRGKYFEAALGSMAYRKDVELTLNIRSQI